MGWSGWTARPSRAPRASRPAPTSARFASRPGTTCWRSRARTASSPGGRTSTSSRARSRRCTRRCFRPAGGGASAARARPRRAAAASRPRPTAGCAQARAGRAATPAPSRPPTAARHHAVAVGGGSPPPTPHDSAARRRRRRRAAPTDVGNARRGGCATARSPSNSRPLVRGLDRRQEHHQAHAAGRLQGPLRQAQAELQADRTCRSTTPRTSRCAPGGKFKQRYTLATRRVMTASERHDGRRARRSTRLPPPTSRRRALTQLDATWREYYRRAAEPPRHPAARDFLHRDLQEALARLIPADASVLEAGARRGDLLAALPNARRHGIDYLPEMVAQARARHPGHHLRRRGRHARRPRWAGSRPRARDAVICDRLCHSVLDVKRAAAGPEEAAGAGRPHLPDRLQLPVGGAGAPGRARRVGSGRRRTANWLSDTDFRNLFDITGLEVVRFEDRLLLPLDVPGASARR